MSNLRFIDKTTLTASVNDFTVTDLFSADFDIYKIVITDTQTSGSTFTNVHARLINSAGSIDTSATYDYMFLRLLPNTNFQSDGRGTGQTLLKDLVYTAKDGGSSANNVMYVFNPFSVSSYTFVKQQSSVSEDSAYRGQKYVGVQDKLVSNTGLNFTLAHTDRPITGMQIITYGLAVN